MASNRKLSEQLMICCGVALIFYTAKNLLFSEAPPVPTQPNLRSSIVDLPPKPRMLVATRIHMKAASSMPDVSKVVKFIKNSQVYSDGILICLGAENYEVVLQYIVHVKKSLTENSVDFSHVHFLPVFPWGYFVTSLNAAVQYAQDNLYTLIAFQSLEVSVSEYEVERVVHRLREKNTLVVGPVLEGHEFIPGMRSGSPLPLIGRTCPWNTFAVWRVRELGFVGFPLIGDGTGEDRACGGVEELTAITMLQKIRPEFSAVLLKIAPQHGPADSVRTNVTTSTTTSNERATWDTKFEDPERQRYHLHKMQSKNARPASQLEAMGIEPGTVLHEAIE